jgi:hypothetical protein
MTSRFSSVSSFPSFRLRWPACRERPRRCRVERRRPRIVACRPAQRRLASRRARCSRLAHVAPGQRQLLLSHAAIPLSRQAGTFALVPQIVRRTRTGDCRRRDRRCAWRCCRPCRRVRRAGRHRLPAVPRGHDLARPSCGDCRRRGQAHGPDELHRSSRSRHRQSTDAGAGRAERSAPSVSPRSYRGCFVAPRPSAWGRADFSPLWAGQNVTGCQPIPAAELTRSLMRVAR